MTKIQIYYTKIEKSKYHVSYIIGFTMHYVEIKSLENSLKSLRVAISIIRIFLKLFFKNC